MPGVRTHVFRLAVTWVGFGFGLGFGLGFRFELASCSTPKLRPAGGSRSTWVGPESG